MSSLRHLSIALLYCSAAVGFSLGAAAQTVTPQGGEFPLLESIALRGDQNFPQISVNSNGGYVVWQDNAIDGNGFGIGARYLDSTFSPGLFGSFRVNQQAAGDQVHPQVATFPDGGAAFVWEGGPAGAHNIFLRFLTPARVFSTGTDLRVNVYTNGTQSTPALGALPNGNLVVAWSSSGQDGSLQGIFARLVTRSGQFVTSPFQINQYTTDNQRNPSLAVYTNGTFVITWISDRQSNPNSLDVYGRVYNSDGHPLSDEFRINAVTALCANPSVSFQSTGSFTVVWAQRTTFDTNSWDIVARTLAVDGAP